VTPQLRATQRRMTTSEEDDVDNGQSAREPVLSVDLRVTRRRPGRRSTASSLQRVVALRAPSGGGCDRDPSADPARDPVVAPLGRRPSSSSGPSAGGRAPVVALLRPGKLPTVACVLPVQLRKLLSWVSAGPAKG
jgi:hypothetical protein